MHRWQCSEGQEGCRAWVCVREVGKCASFPPCICKRVGWLQLQAAFTFVAGLGVGGEGDVVELPQTQPLAVHRHSEVAQVDGLSGRLRDLVRGRGGSVALRGQVRHAASSWVGGWVDGQTDESSPVSSPLLPLQQRDGWLHHTTPGDRCSDGESANSSLSDNSNRRLYLLGCKNQCQRHSTDAKPLYRRESPKPMQRPSAKMRTRYKQTKISAKMRTRCKN